MAEYTYDFSDLLDEIDLENVGLKDIKGILEQLSVDELIGNNKSAPFAPDRITYLYSGYYDINGVYVGAGTVANAIDDGRTLDKTIAARFLTDDTSGYNDIFRSAFINDVENGSLDLSFVDKTKLNDEQLMKLNKFIENPSLSNSEIDDVIKIAQNSYNYHATEGAWATISGKFVADTKPESKIQSLVPENVDINRTWGQVEVINTLEKLPDEQAFGSKTVGEFKQLRDSEGLNAVYDHLKSNSNEFVNSILTDEAVIHFDIDGSVEGINLPNNSAKYSSDVNFSVGDIKQFKTLDEMNVLTDGQYSSGTKLQQLEMQKLELDSRDINVNNLSKLNEIPDELDNARLFFDKDGKLTKMDVSDITGGKPIDAPKEISYIRAGVVIYGENDYVHTTYKRVFAWSKNCFTSCGDKKRVKTKRVKRQGAILDGCPLPFVSLSMKKISENAFTLSVKNVIIY